MAPEALHVILRAPLDLGGDLLVACRLLTRAPDRRWTHRWWVVGAVVAIVAAANSFVAAAVADAAVVGVVVVVAALRCGGQRRRRSRRPARSFTNVGSSTMPALA